MRKPSWRAVEADRDRRVVEVQVFHHICGIDIGRGFTSTLQEITMGWWRRSDRGSGWENSENPPVFGHFSLCSSRRYAIV
jgi:hypothetical protein